jgi:hypothetical protein
MGKIGKGKQLVSLSLPDEWLAEIDRRAASLRLTRATYTLMIIERWWESGKSPVSEPDRLVQIANASKAAARKR